MPILAHPGPPALAVRERPQIASYVGPGRIRPYLRELENRRRIIEVARRWYAATRTEASR